MDPRKERVQLPGGAWVDTELAAIAWTPEPPPETPAERREFLLGLLKMLEG